MALTGNIKGPTGLVANYSVSALKSASTAPDLLFITDSGKEGLFKYDSSDTTTTNDDITTIVAGSKRFKRIYDAFYVNPKWFGAKGDGITNDTTALQNCLSFSKNIRFEGGHYKITSPLTLTNHNIEGNHFNVFIDCYGCDGLKLSANSSNKVSGIYVTEYSSTGTIDSKAKIGLSFLGVLNSVSYKNTITDVYVRGFNIASNCKYMSESVFTNVSANNCNYGLLYWGQCVNNNAINCYLSCSISCIETQKDTVNNTVGEGLIMVGCLMANAQFGFRSDGFLLAQISSCILDFISVNAIQVTNAKSLHIDNSWLYSTQDCIVWNNLSVLVDQSSTVKGCTIESTAGVGITVNNNNSNIKILDNSITTSGAANTYIFVSQSLSKKISFCGNSCNTSLATYQVFLGGSDSQVLNNTGNCNVYYSDFSMRNSIGNNSSESIITRNTSFPTAGTWNISDIIYNTNPTEGGYLGWVCVSGGTPGTWKGFGLIQA